MLYFGLEGVNGVKIGDKEEGRRCWQGDPAPLPGDSEGAAFNPWRPVLAGAPGERWGSKVIGGPGS